MKKEPGKNYIGYEMTREEAAKLGFDLKTQYGKIRIGSNEKYGVLIEAPKKIVREYTRFDSREEQRVARARRCTVSSAKTGRIIRCTGDCKKCDRMKCSNTLSLDRFKDEDDLELSAPTYKISDDALRDVMVESFVKTLEEHDPMLAEVFCRMYDGQTQQAIADELGVTKRAIQTAVERYRKILQALVTREDILR